MSRQRGFLGLEGAVLYLVVGLATALLLSWAGSGMAIWWLDGKVTAANDRATAATAQAAREKQSRQGFEAAATTCSASVERLMRVAQASEDRWKAKLAGSRQETAQAEGLVRDIISRSRPAGLSECEAMKKELDDEIDRRAAGH